MQSTVVAEERKKNAGRGEEGVRQYFLYSDGDS